MTDKAIEVGVILPNFSHPVSLKPHLLSQFLGDRSVQIVLQQSIVWLKAFCHLTLDTVMTSDIYGQEQLS